MQGGGRARGVGGGRVGAGDVRAGGVRAGAVRTRIRALLPALLPWLLLAGLALWLTADGQRGWGPTLAYQGYVLVAVTVPGLLVKRMLLGSATLVEDLGIGFPLGATGQLVLWALHQLLGGPAWLMWLGPVAVVAAAGAVPALRHRALGAGRGRCGPAPVWFHWTIAALTGVGLVGLWRTQLVTPPLAGANYLYQDLWYHLALDNEMLRAFPLASPDAVGVPLTYHWFSNAYMAAGHLMSGVDLYSILVRQWLVPMFVACILGTIAVARRVSDSWHAAWIAAAAAFVLPAGFVAYGWPESGAAIGFIPASPSNIFGLVLLLGCVAVVLQVWQTAPRGRVDVGGWAAVVVLVGGSMGAKPSVLPLVGCLAGAWVVASLFGRGRPWRTRVSWAGLAVGVLAVLGVMVGSGIVSDDAQSGSALQLGGFLKFMPGFLAMAGLSWPTSSGEGGPVHPALLAGGDQTRAVLVAVGWLLLVESPHWLAVLALPAGRLRNNRATWALAGAIAGAWAVFAVVDHPGFSEVYFPRTVIPLATVLTAVVVAETARVSRVALAAVLASAAGTIAIVAVAWQDTSPRIDKGSPFFDLARVALVVVALCAVVWLGQRLLEHEAARRASLVGLVVAGVLAGSLYASGRTQLVRPAIPAPEDRWYVSPAEIEAARWLGENSRLDDVVASATLCTPAGGVAPNCRGDQFWITGISGRRMLLAGWYYLPNGSPALAGPGSIDRRMATSQRLVSAPDPATVARAKEYGVRWVFADRTTGPVSPELARYGEVRFDNGTVQVVELH